MPTTSKRSARNRSRSRGQSLVEFALVFPVFILILSGILDFGFMLYSRMTVINAVREGARVAVTATDKTTIPVLVQAKVTDVSTALAPANMDPATVECVEIKTLPTCDFTAGADPNGVPGDAVRVTVNYRYLSFFPLLFGTTFNLSSTVQMVLE